MEDNPYSKFIEKIMSKGSQLTLYSGQVINTSPLTINVAGIKVSGNEIMVNAAMLKHNVSISDGNILTPSEITPDLTIGDTVLLLTVDTQIFYVLCKVVGI